MDAIAANYDTYRAWFERSFDLIWRLPPELKAKERAIQALSDAEGQSRARAAKSLLAGLADTIALTDRYSSDEIRKLDGLFSRDELPTLTSMRLLMSKRVRKALKSGIQSEEEYDVVKALEDADLPINTIEKIRVTLADYELKRLAE